MICIRCGKQSVGTETYDMEEVICEHCSYQQSSYIDGGAIVGYPLGRREPPKGEMMNQKLIKKLKQNEKPFGLLNKEEQEYLKEVGRNNCLFFNGNKWINLDRGTFFILDNTYRIKSDYNPEPEYTDYKIKLLHFVKKNQYLLGIEIHNIKWPLYKIPSILNFDCFWVNVEGKGCPELNAIRMEKIAHGIKEGFEIYARFLAVNKEPDNEN